MLLKLVANGDFLPIWPLTNPRWPLSWALTSAMYFTLVKVFFYQFGSHRAFLRNLGLWMTFDLCWGRFENNMLSKNGVYPALCRVLAQYLLKYDEMHSRTNTHTLPQTHPTTSYPYTHTHPTHTNTHTQTQNFILVA